MACSTNKVFEDDNRIWLQIMEKIQHLNDHSSEERTKERTELEKIILSTDHDILLNDIKAMYFDTKTESTVIFNQGTHHRIFFNTRNSNIPKGQTIRGSTNNAIDLQSLVMISHVLLTTEDSKYIKHIRCLEIQIDKYRLEPSIIDAYYNYLSIYYKGVMPSECFNRLHVWRLCPKVEIQLKLLYCRSLLRHKHHHLFLQLIMDNMEYFISADQTIYLWLQNCICDTYNMILVQLFILGKIHLTKRLIMILSGTYFDKRCLDFEQFIPFINTKTLLSLINAQDIAKEPLCKLGLCLLYCKILRNQNDSTCISFKQFVEQHYEFLVSMAVKVTTEDVPCIVREQYCFMLFHMIYLCDLVKSTISTELVMSLVQTFKSLLNQEDVEKHDLFCYCYGESQKCKRIREKTKLKYPYMFGSSEISADRNYILKKSDEIIQRHDSISSYLNKIRLYKHPYHYGDNFIIHLEVAEKILKHSEIYKQNQEKGLKEIIEYSLKLEPETQDICIQFLCELLKRIYVKEPERVAKIILDVNITKREDFFVQKLTKHIGKLEAFQDHICNDQNRVLHKLFSLVRAAKRKGILDVNLTEYLEHFTFIPMYDKEEEIAKMSKLSEFLVILILLLIAIGSNGQHKSAQMKKYLTLKYEYEDAILYLLWCSGDVEINPGPTLRKLQSPQPSLIERKWIQEMCSSLVKLLKGIPANSKPKSLWREKPAGWPKDQPFYDPSNKAKFHNDDSQSDKELLNCSLKQWYKLVLVKQKEGVIISLPNYMEEEISAWKTENTSLLFELFISRHQTEEIQTMILNLMKYKDTYELKHHLKGDNFKIDFSNISASGPACIPAINVVTVKSKGYAEIVRDLALTFCRIAKDLNILEKSDGIWKVPPVGWKQTDPFYSPHNAGKRTEKDQDGNLVDNLLMYCEQKDIKIPKELQRLVGAWKQKNKEDIIRSYTIWSSRVTIEHSLKYLQLENLLDNANVIKALQDIGLILDAKAWNLQNSHKNKVQCIKHAETNTDLTNQSLTSSCHPSSQSVSKGHQTSETSSFDCIQKSQVCHSQADAGHSTSTSLPSTSKSLRQVDSMADVHQGSSSKPNNKRKLSSCTVGTQESLKKLVVSNDIDKQMPSDTVPSGDNTTVQNRTMTHVNKYQCANVSNFNDNHATDMSNVKDKENTEQPSTSHTMPDDLLNMYINDLLQVELDDLDEKLWRDMDL